MTAQVTTGAPSLFGSGLVARRVDGRAMRTVDGVLDALAAAWAFPAHFGHNRDALDDCMRDLPTGLFTADGAPATGYLTIITHAEELLADEPEELGWFVESVDFWADHYRPGGFAVTLETADPHAVEARWAAASTSPQED